MNIHVHETQLFLHVISKYKPTYAEAEDIKKRWQEYTEELYKKDLQEPDNYDGVITHLEPHSRHPGM